MKEKTFRITFSGSFSMTSAEIWPDGDAPEKPTARDVRNTMINHGGKSNLLSDWNLENDLDITILDEDGKTEEWQGL
jgi:hypothetical protein